MTKLRQPTGSLALSCLAGDLIKASSAARYLAASRSEQTQIESYFISPAPSQWKLAREFIRNELVSKLAKIRSASGDNLIVAKVLFQ